MFAPIYCIVTENDHNNKYYKIFVYLYRSVNAVKNLLRKIFKKKKTLKINKAVLVEFHDFHRHLICV